MSYRGFGLLAWFIASVTQAQFPELVVTPITDKTDSEPVSVDNDVIAPPTPMEILQRELRTVHFDYVDAQLSIVNQTRLNRIAAIMSLYPDLRLRIQGYANDYISAPLNRQLSHQRAEKIKDHLIGEQISGSKLCAIAMGNTDTRDQGDVAQKRLNRRVELIPFERNDSSWCPEEIIETGPSIVGEVYFELDSSVLSPVARKALDAFVTELGDSGMTVKLQGFTDSIGKNQYNQKLSQSRAERVRQYLIEAGVTRSHISIEALGENHQKYRENELLNRRVQLSAYPPLP